ncbi:hypothetical protein BGX28_010268, partial [Mortierella sp. GBA30]
MQKALAVLSEALENRVSTPIKDMEVLPNKERELLLKTWNGALMDSTDHICLHQHFEQHVERTPGSIAVVHEDNSLSYDELNTRANGLAHKLIQVGVNPDTKVAICVKRSPAIIIGILAILKAGGAYVPLDPVYASERLIDILSDASPSILLADSHGVTALQGADLTALTVIDPNTSFEGSTDNPHVSRLSTHHLAYVMYTSGSTGKPKGVMVEHRQITRLFEATATAWFNFSENDTWCLLHSFSFDFSVWEMWGALRYGGKLVLASYDVARSAQELYSFVCEHGVTVLNVTPSVFKLIVDSQLRHSTCDRLRYINFGGEALSTAMLRPWFANQPQDRPQIANMYGPTETTVYATFRLITAKDCDQLISPIGVRLPDLRTYVLDGRCQPVPVGVVGELYIGGAGVARGYLNRPDLTEGSFLPDPFVELPEARMYKTGDLVRYLKDGELEFLGRNDHQIKIRGFRVEPGEIETRLKEHPLVSESVVVVLGEEMDKRLVAYVVARCYATKAHLVTTLRSHLMERLPEYMIPAAFVRLDALPLTPIGKLDQRALPIPSDEDFARQEHEPPKGQIEIALASIWSDLLHVESVGRHDSFFSMGGHSLLAVRLMNRISTLGVNIPLSSLFASSTLSALAAVVSEHLRCRQENLPNMLPTPRDGMLPLSFAQQRLWFLAQLEEASNTYNIPVAIRLHGEFNKNVWQQALDELYARHEALR